MPHPPLRLALAALVALLGFWLLSQLTVATWLARAAIERGQDWTQGVSPWQWDFSDPSSVVWPGSHGLDEAKRDRDGLSVSLPQDGTASLSLALRDEWIDLAAVDHARIKLQSDAPLRLFLLSTQPHRVWLQAELERGTQRIELPLIGRSEDRTDAMQLRIETQPHASVRLQRLLLVNRDCARAHGCPDRSQAAPFFLTPERLLAFRDARGFEEPATSIVSGNRLGRLGQWLGLRLDGLSVVVMAVMAAGLSILLLAGLWRRFRALKPSPSRLRAGLELVATLGSAVVLLLSGWPARDTPVPIGLLLLLCLGVLALTPTPTPRTWRWLVDVSAWRAALRFTALAALLTAPLLLLDRGSVTTRDSLSLLHYPAWALLQQWLLIAAIMPRLRVLLPDPRAAALAGGVLFALLHAPNFALMSFTFAGGSAWAWLGQRHRALVPLALSHVALGWWLLYVAPIWILRSAEIGGRYLMPP